MASCPITSHSIYDIYDTDSDELYEFFELPKEKLSMNSEKWRTIVCTHLQNLLTRRDTFKIHSLGEGLVWLNTCVPLKLDDELKGKVVVFDFFTYCCVNCEHVLPLIQRIDDAYEANPELVVIGIHSPKHTNEKNLDSVKDALKKNKISHPVINDSENIVWNTLNINCWPTVLILGPDQKVLFSLVGETAIEKLEFLCELTLEFFHTKGITLNASPLPVECEKSLDENQTLLYPSGISCSEECLLVSDTGHDRLFLMAFDGKVVEVIGNGSKGHVDGSYFQCSFNSPHGSCWLEDSIAFVADTANDSIRVIDMKNRKVFTAFDGNAHVQPENLTIDSSNDEEVTIHTSKFKSPWDVCIGPQRGVESLQTPDNMEKFANMEASAGCSNDVIPRIEMNFSAETTHLRKGPQETRSVFIAVAGSHQIWMLHWEQDLLCTRNFSGFRCSPIAGHGKEERRDNYYWKKAGFAQPSAICFSPLQTFLIVDSESSSLRSMSYKKKKVETIVGGDKNPLELFGFGDKDGVGMDVKLQHPLGICLHMNSIAFIADTYNHKIKQVDIFKKRCITYAGTGTKGNRSFVSRLEADFNEPSSLCYDKDINLLFIADTNNHCVKFIDLDKELVETLDITFLSVSSIDGPQSKRQAEWKKEEEINEVNGPNDKKIQLHCRGRIKCTFKLSQGKSVTEGSSQPWTVKFNG